MHTLKPFFFILMALIIGVMFGCDTKLPPDTYRPYFDSGTEDAILDVTPPEDTAVIPVPDADSGAPDTHVDVREEDTSDPPVPAKCPESMRDSCLFDALSCAGPQKEPIQYTDFSQWLTVEFSNNSRATYQTVMLAGEERLRFQAISPSGEACYIATNAEVGATDHWQVVAGARRYKLLFEQDLVSITCPSGVEEVCSRGKFEQFLTFPSVWPDAETCSPYSPDDQCQFDDDCAQSQGCCPAGAGQFKQCLSLEFCTAQRPPIPCETTANCSGDKVCQRCTRSGIRECVPASIAADTDNNLGCIADLCQVDAGQCDDPRICCKFLDLYRCSMANECDSAPDPNPICNPGDANLCTNANQQCCYVSQLAEFRCIGDSGLCQTDVCYGNVDCGGETVCCGHDASQGIAGSCVETCDSVPPPCTTADQCQTDPAYCCIWPGYTAGSCVQNVDECIVTQCQTDAGCEQGQTCCGAFPLSTPICTDENQCPPAP